MSKFCPKCGTSIPEKSMYCPCCYERFTNPTEDNSKSNGYPVGTVTCPSCQKLVTLTGSHCPNCNYKIIYDKPKTLMESYIEYEKFKGKIGAVILPIVGTIILILSIVGAFFNLIFLVGLAVAGFLYICGLLCYVLSRDF